MNFNNYIPYLEIPKQLSLQKNDILLISSDISHLAMIAMRNEKEFSANRFIDSFQDCVSDGTILIPAFITDLSKLECYNPKSTPPQMGTLSLTAFKRIDFKRTYDPLHSFLAWGRHQEELINLKSNSTFGDNSCFAFLNSFKAKMLMIDISYEMSFTFAHYIEEHLKVKYRRYKKISYARMSDNNEILNESILFYAKKAGYINNLNWLDTEFEQNKVSRNFKINNIPFKLIDLNAAHEFLTRRTNLNKNNCLAIFNFKQFLKDILRKPFNL